MTYEINLLRELFDYHDDGFFVRRVRTGPRTSVGQEVRGFLRKDGYRVIAFAGKKEYLHRAVFAWHHGYYPAIVDHKDRDQENNRIKNLREADPVLSSQNQGPNHNSSTGIKGVFPYRNGQFFAQVNRNRVCTYLGIFDSLAEAQKAVEEFN